MIFKLNYVFKSLSIVYIMAPKPWDRFSPKELLGYVSLFRKVVIKDIGLRPEGYTKQELLEIAQTSEHFNPKDKIWQPHNRPVARSLLGRALYLLENPKDPFNKGKPGISIEFDGTKYARAS